MQTLTEQGFKYKHTTKSRGYKPEKDLSRYGLWYRKQRRLLVEKYGGRCQWLGCDCMDRRVLEFAHIKPTPLSNTLEGRGSLTRLHDILANSDCYMLLCSDHHKILDGRAGKL